MQFSLFASIFLLFFLPLYTYAEIDGCEKTWLIKNLTIDEINENPSSAKNTAERKVSKLAFERLIEKIPELTKVLDITDHSNRENAYYK